MKDQTKRDKLSCYREQASLWLVRLLEGMSSQQQEYLQKWLDSDKKHAEALLEMASIWDEMGILSNQKLKTLSAATMEGAKIADNQQ